ncbi:MAG: DUF3488 and transglutaminase-like domain-containing protein [Terrimicrobiaceae bacterium]
MIPETSREKYLAWALGGLTALHAFLLSPSDDLFYLTILLIFAGAAARGAGWLAPGWLVFPIAWVSAIVAAGWEGTLWPGAAGILLSAVALFSPLTPRRTKIILFGLLIGLVGITPHLPPLWSPTFAALDVATALVVCQEVHRPPEAKVTLWRSLFAALRLGLPVSLAVVLLFWLFPSVAPRDPWVGFSSGMLDPGRASAVRRSSRPAFSVRFIEGSPIPRASELYWRCEILDLNDGMRWSRSLARPTRAEPPPPVTALVSWEYEMFPIPHSALPLLDRPANVQAFRYGGAEPPELLAGGVFRLDDLADVRLRVTSSPPGKESHQPGPQNLQAPRPDSRLEKLSNQLVANQPGVGEAMDAVRKFFAEGGFVYSLRPGRQKSSQVSEFLFLHRRGFCEHYAAAAANIFRLGGVPARVVTGYRGGEWNPWLREITVRQSDAHAWVELWDPPTQSWLRFDPTDAVTPDFSEMSAEEMDPSRWPWHRILARQLAAWSKVATQTVAPWLAPISTSALLLGLIAATWWLWRLGSRTTPREAAARQLARIEALLSSTPLARIPGETPLAWLARMRSHSMTSGAPLADLLDASAKEYDMVTYSSRPPQQLNSLRSLPGQISRHIKSFRLGSPRLTV